jgi:hypothetical protein
MIEINATPTKHAKTIAFLLHDVRDGRREQIHTVDDDRSPRH